LILSGEFFYPRKIHITLKHIIHKNVSAKFLLFRNAENIIYGLHRIMYAYVKSRQYEIHTLKNNIMKLDNTGIFIAAHFNVFKS